MSLLDLVRREVERNALRAHDDIRSVGGAADRPGRFTRQTRTTPAQQWVALDGKAIAGYVAVRPLPPWSDHVGELRLVVHPAHRRAGLGRALARHAHTEAVRAGRRKLVVELAADQGHVPARFGSLGFTGEASLRDHIRHRNGQLHDLVVLAHFVDGTWTSIDTVGLTDEFGLTEEPGREGSPL